MQLPVTAEKKKNYSLFLIHTQLDQQEQLCQIQNWFQFVAGCEFFLKPYIRSR